MAAPRGNSDGRPAESDRAAAPAASAARGNLTALQERLAEVIGPVARQAGFDLEQVRVSRVGRRHSVQIIIDRDEGVGLDAIAEVSHAVSGALDTADESGDAVMPGEYVLEVSSPGVDRPLTQPRHWRRNTGRLVTVPGPDGRTLTGRITAATGDAVVLDVDGAARSLQYEQLGPGRVQVELRPAGAGDEDGDDGEDEQK